MRRSENRIEMSMALMDAIVVIAEGNPGAAMAVAANVNRTPKIDPDSAMGVFTVPLSLDSFGIYGSKIHILYKDVCGQDVVKFHGILRAIQLGFIYEEEVHGYLEEGGQTAAKLRDMMPDLMLQVRAQLPNFAKE